MAFTMDVDGLPDLPKMYNLSYGVGPSRSNQRDDVMLVQQLLQMACLPIFAGGLPAGGTSTIKVDGYYGPETAAMIKSLEDNLRRDGKLFVADGAIDSAATDGFTNQDVLYKIVFLNRYAKAQDQNSYNLLPFDPSNNALLRSSLLPNATPLTPRDPVTGT